MTSKVARAMDAMTNAWAAVVDASKRWLEWSERLRLVVELADDTSAQRSIQSARRGELAAWESYEAAWTAYRHAAHDFVVARDEEARGGS